MLNISMKISTRNEYGKLKSVILGRPQGANWPTGDIFFDRMMQLSSYKPPLARGPVSEDVIQKANDDLFYMRDLLEDHDVKVYRPEIMDYTRTVTHADHTTSGMHSYSARDLILTVGDMAIECPTPFVSRYREFDAYDVIKQEAMRDGCRWIAAPRARMEPAECIFDVNKIKLTERYPIFDAANVLKFDDKLLYLKTSTANHAGAEWLQNVVGTEFEVIKWDKVYAHAHIDSTLISLKKDMILINASRVNSAERLPKFLRGHRKIWVQDMAEGKFTRFPYASKWIGMNILSIDDETVMIDPIQKDLIKQLRAEGFNCIEVSLTQSRTLGGGHHCVTCDLERE
jgi:N-dimethylarginine dimethylaminohydrolase